MHRRQTVTLDIDKELDRLEALATWLDSRFRIPGTEIRFGLDALAGLIPGVGDGATSLLSLYIVATARRLGVPLPLLLRMGWNVLVDLVVGSIPLVGDLFDIGFRANRRNVALMRDYFRGRSGR